MMGILPVLKIHPYRSPNFVFFIQFHRICSTHPGGSGTVRVRSGKTCAGVYQGSLLLSTQGQPHGLDFRPCKGVSLCTRTESTLAALPKAVPAGGILAHWSSQAGPLYGPAWERRNSESFSFSLKEVCFTPTSWRALLDTRLFRWFPILLI